MDTVPLLPSPKPTTKSRSPSPSRSQPLGRTLPVDVSESIVSRPVVPFGMKREIVAPDPVAIPRARPGSSVPGVLTVPPLVGGGTTGGGVTGGGSTGGTTGGGTVTTGTGARWTSDEKAETAPDTA